MSDYPSNTSGTNSIFPSLGFVKAESSIEGIEVFMPEVETLPELPAVISFTCPRCGGTTAYSIKNRGLQCTYCGYLQEEVFDQVGREAEENEFLLETMNQAGKGWGETRQELECQNCGAKVTVPQVDLTHTCAFCNSNKVLLQAAEQPGFRPEYLIPFRIEQDRCIAIAREFLGSSWMVPVNLRNSALIRFFTPIYFSFWTFDAGLSSSWKAQVGHIEHERYYDASDRTWKTRPKTVWRWENGNVHLQFDDLIISGTSRLSRIHLNQVSNFNFSEMIEYTPSVLAGFRAIAYEVPLEQAWDQARKLMREQTRKACIDQASTSMVRNLSMQLDFQDESYRLLLLPIYLAAYSYAGKVYQVLLNGQTGAISGQRPVDWQKVWLVIAALLTPGLLLGLFGLFTLPLAGIGALPGVLGVFLFLLGCVISIIIGVQASRLDDA